MITSPNQRVITVKAKEIEKGTKRPYLIIYRDLLEQACRNLQTASAITVYLYLASNQNSFSFGFSPKAISTSYGISEDSVRNGFNKLIEKGYLIETSSNHFDFYTQPKSKITTTTPEPKKHFKDDETGEVFYLTRKELIDMVGSKEEADYLWETQED